MDSNLMKRAAGIAACNWVKDGMAVGLGTGSTVSHTVVELGRLISDEGLSIVGVPTSIATRDLAISVGVPLVGLSDVEILDLVIDGTDEFDHSFSLIKGGGGALTREKIVAQRSRAMLVVADETKQVQVLGTFPLPVEVLPFEWEVTMSRLSEICPGKVKLRGALKPFVTDNGGYIIDCDYQGVISNPKLLESEILCVAGVVEVGLFCGICDAVVMAGGMGVETLLKENGRIV